MNPPKNQTKPARFSITSPLNNPSLTILTTINTTTTTTSFLNPLLTQPSTTINTPIMFIPYLIHARIVARPPTLLHTTPLCFRWTMSLLALEVEAGYFVIPKSEEVSRPIDFASRIGLNLGGRTYFSSTDDDFVNRLYRRSRPGEPGSSNSPRCQAEGCNADLTHAKHYHRRHKVCEFHSKASTVIAAGLTQRFCQQCSRFHLLSEFDNGKRSCRKRLADHNRRRRKSQQQPNLEGQKPQSLETACNSSSENIARSPPDSGIHSSSSVTVAVSPPRMSLDCYRQRPYQANAASSSASQSSLFFSTG
ncbi:hypothetical protein Patl1_00165 [Pistacia atlantica]|uniref:Uncharacterized protein n=1 Tax=Pistacia atlantica TaxID=434234 RepID=A0ACC1CD15_9ROSI|nr:hypothetical protein Patl1_00165 [Pistacia atlantica]